MLAAFGENLPVVASGISVSILKAIRDTSSSSNIGSEVSYFSRRNPIDSDGLVLESEKSAPYVCRDFYCTQEIPNELRAFMSERPG